MDFKKVIIENLETLRKRDVAKGERFKARAYDVVIKQLKAREEPIHTLEDVVSMKGVGEKIKIKIQEIIETGELAQAKVEDEEVTVINDLSRVFGIGPIRARELYSKHHIKSLEELKSNQDILNDKQKIGLKYYEDFERRIPRAEMDKHVAFVTEIVKHVDPKLEIAPLGSYRRGAKDSGDIDFLITHEDDPEDYLPLFDKVVEALVKEKYIADTFAKGNKKYNGVARLKRHRVFRRIDLMYTRKANEYPFALLYFTGSGDLNIKLRALALEKGYTINEYGIKHTDGPSKGEFVKERTFHTEEDIFNFLGLKFIPPTERNNVSDFSKYLL